MIEKEIATMLLYILIITFVACIGLQIYSISKIQILLRETKTVIRCRRDLLAVKDVINLNMKLAILYIVLFIGVFIIAVHLFVTNSPLSGAAILFIFGTITLPFGLIGKHFENKIKSMEIQSSEPDIEETFKRYLVQWKQARFKLPD